MHYDPESREVVHGSGGGTHTGGGAGAGYGIVGGGTSFDFQVAQQRIDNLRGIALRQAVDVHGGKISVDGNALDADLIVRSARQFYAFLSGDTPTEG